MLMVAWHRLMGGGLGALTSLKKDLIFSENALDIQKTHFFLTKMLWTFQKTHFFLTKIFPSQNFRLA